MAVTHHHDTEATGEPHPASAAQVDLSAGRRKVARSRGALSGILLVVLGAWAALAPFIGPYFNFALEPKSDDAWHWTSGRGLYELLPGGVAVLAGIVLLVSASRALTLVMAWLAALAGAWLVIAPTVDASLDVGVGGPPSGAGTGKVVALGLLFFVATGAAIVLVAGTALGRLSVHSVRDVRAAERRAEAEAAARAEEARLAERRQADIERERHNDAAAAAHRDHHDGHHDGHHDRHDTRSDEPGPEPAQTPVAPQQPGYAQAPATPYGPPQGGRDTAGSSGYSGYRPEAQPQQPGQQPVQQPGHPPQHEAGPDHQRP